MTKPNALLLAALLLSGCESANNPGQPGQAPHEAPVADDLVYPEGWTQVLIQANSANTTLDNAGHFYTSRNACGAEAAGVYAVVDWNPYIRLINQVVATPALAQPLCGDYEWNTLKFAYNGNGSTAVINTAQGPRTLYEIRNYQLCTTVSDVKLDKALFQQIEGSVNRADKEDCPNGWGSDH